MKTTGTVPTLADVRMAADRITGLVDRTPLLALDSRLLLKAEHRQRGGSFKARGAANAMLARYADEVVAGSSGNHGIAVAMLGAALGIRVTIVMAAGASDGKAQAIRSLGAGVVQVDGGVVERDRRAEDIAAATGAVFVPSSDHELVVAGAGTVGLEVFEDVPGVSTIFVPTGGGGLLAGVCLAASVLSRPVRIVGVEPMSARRYAVSVTRGAPTELPPSMTIADGLRGQRPGAVPWPIIRHRVDDLIGVTDDAITHALGVLRRAGVSAEPSGAVALAGALRRGSAGPAVAIVSGGNGTVGNGSTRTTEEPPAELLPASTGESACSSLRFLGGAEESRSRRIAERMQFEERLYDRTNTARVRSAGDHRSDTDHRAGEARPDKSIQDVR
ncbi:pyridoxal-5'-phosphate-dependent enzyme, beta subunit [Micromonospora sp. ATCC 39149]|uniref:Pyridoxal-phosphate dependent enzyme n=1 Tax=Micromonospora carbonacea TaxID=47853 RepID=A0A7D6GIS4_9ACTN|nr:pyridoxal-5'-phosphate-dependent enzyme, beta subunit [Micromonospora sp. ATCC 39149]QLK00650.1 pyridoxal-phosphate dependent enzyme [Micromonospora carbonacea]